MAPAPTCCEAQPSNPRSRWAQAQGPATFVNGSALRFARLSPAAHAAIVLGIPAREARKPSRGFIKRLSLAKRLSVVFRQVLLKNRVLVNVREDVDVLCFSGVGWVVNAMICFTLSPLIYGTFTKRSKSIEKGLWPTGMTGTESILRNRSKPFARDSADRTKETRDVEKEGVCFAGSSRFGSRQTSRPTRACPVKASSQHLLSRGKGMGLVSLSLTDFLHHRASSFTSFDAGQPWSPFIVSLVGGFVNAPNRSL